MAGPLLILLCMLFIRATVAISPRLKAVLVVKIKENISLDCVTCQADMKIH